MRLVNVPENVGTPWSVLTLLTEARVARWRLVTACRVLNSTMEASRAFSAMGPTLAPGKPAGGDREAKGEAIGHAYYHIQCI